MPNKTFNPHLPSNMDFVSPKKSQTSLKSSKRPCCTSNIDHIKSEKSQTSSAPKRAKHSDDEEGHHQTCRRTSNTAHRIQCHISISPAFPKLSGLVAASNTQRPHHDRTLRKKCKHRLRPRRVGITKGSLLDPNILEYSRFCFSRVASPPSLLSFPFSSGLWVSHLYSLAPLSSYSCAPHSCSSRSLFSFPRCPVVMGIQVICAVSSPWGSPYGTIVLDSL